MERSRRPRGGVRSVLGERWLEYVLIYAALNVYPLLVYLDVASSSTGYGAVAVLLMTPLWLLGVAMGIPEILVLYYVASSSLLIVSGVPGAPQAYDVVLYFLLAFHADYFSRILVAGIGYRRLRYSAGGAAATAAVAVIIVLVFTGLGVAVSSFFLNVYYTVIDSSPKLLRLSLMDLLLSRPGSLLVLFIVSWATVFVLREYVVGLLSDTVLLNPAYVSDRIRRWLANEAMLLRRNRTWHQRLYVSSVFIFIMMYTWILISPIYSYIGELLRASFHPLLVFATSFALSIFIYGLIRRRIVYVLVPRGEIEAPRPPRPRRPGRGLIYLSVYILGSYMLILYIFRINPLPLIPRALGLESPAPNGPGHELAENMTSMVAWIDREFPRLAASYMDRVARQYEYIVALVKKLIELLWG